MSNISTAETTPTDSNLHSEQIPGEDPIDFETEMGSTAIMDFPGEQEVQSLDQPKIIEELLDSYDKPKSDGWLVRFHGLPEGMAAYNTSKVFEVGGIPHILVREEGKRADEEFTSRLTFYRCSDDGRDCYPTDISNLTELLEGKIAQDPFYAYVCGKHVVTWVEVSLNNVDDSSEGSTYKSVVAIGDSLDDLKILAETDDDTKGLRFVELIDSRIGFTIRTSANSEYKMYFGATDSWENVTKQLLTNAPEVRGLEGLVVNDSDPLKGRWLGPNGMETLANGDVSLLMHFGRRQVNAERSGNKKIYDTGHCVLTPGVDGAPAVARYPKIVSRAQDLNISVEELPPKSDELTLVEYPSGLDISENEGEEATLLTAVRDAGMAYQRVPDPLKEWRVDHPEFADSPFTQS